MTFSGTEPGGFTLPNEIKTSSLCAIISTNSFVSYDNLSTPINYVNKGIRGTGTSSNQPFVNSVTNNYTATTPSASLSTSSITTTKTGYINSNGRLVSLDTFPNLNFISMTGTSNPTYVPSSFGTNEFNLLSRNQITPTTTGSFSAVALTSTSLAYNTFGGVNNDFIIQTNNINVGTKITNNTSNGILTLSLTHSSPIPDTTNCSGYVSSLSLKLESASAFPLGRYVYGTGTTNGIPQNINSFITDVPIAPSSTYTIKQGTATGKGTAPAALTNTTATSGILGYIRSNSSKFWFISTTQQTNNNFIEGTGIPQATRMKTPTSPFVGESKIMELSQINNNTITATKH
jgi:hypothetical protein